MIKPNKNENDLILKNENLRTKIITCKLNKSYKKER